MRWKCTRICKNIVRNAQKQEAEIMTLYENLTRDKKILERMSVI